MPLLQWRGNILPNYIMYETSARTLTCIKSRVSKNKRGSWMRMVPGATWSCVKPLSVNKRYSDFCFLFRESPLSQESNVRVVRVEVRKCTHHDECTQLKAKSKSRKRRYCCELRLYLCSLFWVSLYICKFVSCLVSTICSSQWRPATDVGIPQEVLWKSNIAMHTVGKLSFISHLQQFEIGIKMWERCKALLRFEVHSIFFQIENSA